VADLAQKKGSFIRRYVAAVESFLTISDDLTALATEWSANAYPTGADPAGNNITDEDLATVAPWLTSLQLNQAVGAVDAVHATVEEQRGYLEAVRS
jgi:hypothetical protein